MFNPITFLIRRHFVNSGQLFFHFRRFLKERGIEYDVWMKHRRIIINRLRYQDFIVIYFTDDKWLTVESKKLPKINGMKASITFKAESIEEIIYKMQKFGIFSELDAYRLRYSKQYPIPF